jgi:nucleotide-binding universal stress UspA family protein
MRNILCPTDFSETAQNAIVYAAKLAKAIGADLTLLNIQSPVSIAAIELVSGKSMTLKAVNDLLEEQSNEVTKVFKVSCTAELESSTLSLATLISEKALGYDLLVMGTNGADDYFQYFFGSNSYHVIKYSSVPILLVPAACGYQHISEVVFAYDYHKEHALPVIQLSALTSLLDCRVKVLQVIKNSQREEAGHNLEAVQQAIQNANKMLKLSFDTVYSDAVIDSINHYVKENEVEALALCAVHHRFIEQLVHKSVIKTLSSIADYPLFVFHQ